MALCSCHFPIHIANFLRKLLIASIGETIGPQINFQNFLIKALHLRCILSWQFEVASLDSHLNILQLIHTKFSSWFFYFEALAGDKRHTAKQNSWYFVMASVENAIKPVISWEIRPHKMASDQWNFKDYTSDYTAILSILATKNTTQCVSFESSSCQLKVKVKNRPD